jgi:hypothetical protein
MQSVMAAGLGRRCSSIATDAIHPEAFKNGIGNLERPLVSSVCTFTDSSGCRQRRGAPISFRISNKHKGNRPTVGRTPYVMRGHGTDIATKRCWNGLPPIRRA